MRFVEDSKFDWSLNDSIRYYNKLDYFEKCHVIAGLIEVRVQLIQYSGDKESMLNLMNSAMIRRNQEKVNGPCDPWVLAAMIESLAQMAIFKQFDEISLFFNNRRLGPTNRLIKRLRYRLHLRENEWHQFHQ